MRPFATLLITALAVGACATPRAQTPTQVAAPRPAEAPADATPPAAEAAPTAAPAAEADARSQRDRWLHLDADRDGVRGASVERAYAELLAGREPVEPVVVAIIDSGVDTAHVDLRANLWRNPKEVAGNGVDDDGNGYADDVYGWNFIGGADGENVAHDTYEVTRRYAAYRARFEGADADTLSAAARADYERYRDARAAWEAKRDSTATQVEQIAQMKEAVDAVVALLKSELRTDSLTEEHVASMRPMRLDVRRAQQIYLQLAEDGITQEMIDDEAERLQGVLRYGLNPDFDPRSIVGDDYADSSERRYGNADVTGPDSDHGTHVAGIVGAVRGNGVGVDGIAPAVRIMAIRAVPDGDERDKDVANAIRYAVDNGARVVNMSFGKAYGSDKAAVDAAVRYAETRGVLLVHAAGNDGADLEKTASFPNRTYGDGGVATNWIEVGASSWKPGDALPATFSNYGSTRVDVFAPGHDINSTVPGDGYRRNSGTSMAAPVVSGLAALILAYYPELDAADVRRILLESATPYTDLPVVRPGSQEERVRFGELSATGGVVNAYAALRMAEELAAARR